MNAAAVRVHLERCRAVIGGHHDPLAAEWAAMDRQERAFWLRVSKLPAWLVSREWPGLEGDQRAILKNNLYRAARRAEVILGGRRDAA